MKNFKKKLNKKKNKKRNGTFGRKISQPLAKGRVVKTSNNRNTITVNHREYLRDVVTDVQGFDVHQYDVNPGLESAFPWISKIASAYETYKINKLTFEFITSTGTNRDGSVALIPDYDAKDDNLLQSKQKLMAYDGATRGPVWSDLKLQCKVSNLQKRKILYVRRAPVKSGEDIKLSDALSLIVVVSGVNALVTLGEIWVSYSITFSTPQLEPVESEGLYATSGTSTWPIDKPFQDIGVEYNTVGATVNDDSITFTEPGTYFVDINGGVSGPGASVLDMDDLQDDSEPGTNITFHKIQSVSTAALPGNDFSTRWFLRVYGAVSKSIPAVLSWTGFATLVGAVFFEYIVLSLSAATDQLALVAIPKSIKYKEECHKKRKLKAKELAKKKIVSDLLDDLKNQ